VGVLLKSKELKVGESWLGLRHANAFESCV